MLRMCWHRWTKWQDTEYVSHPSGAPIQVKRCLKCQITKSRTTDGEKPYIWRKKAQYHKVY